MGQIMNAVHRVEVPEASRASGRGVLSRTEVYWKADVCEGVPEKWEDRTPSGPRAFSVAVLRFEDFFPEPQGGGSDFEELVLA